MTKICVIIPTRNRSEHLHRNLTALTQQTVLPDQVIVADNNSSDSTKNVVESFKKKLPIIYLFVKKKGVTYARNEAIQKSKFDIIAMLDDDCIPHNNYIEEIKKNSHYLSNYVIQGATKNRTPSNILSEYIFFLTEVGVRVGIASCKKNNRLIDSKYVFNHVDTKNFIFRRSVIKQVGVPFNHAFAKIHVCEDTELSFRLRKHNLHTIYIPEICVEHNFPTSFFSAFMKLSNLPKRTVIGESLIRKIHEKDFNVIERASKIFGTKQVSKTIFRDTEFIAEVNNSALQSIFSSYTLWQRIQFNFYLYFFRFVWKIFR